jgi:stress response protein SCP2
MRHYLKYALLLSMVAVFALPAFAQDETPEATEGGSSIAIGDTVTGELTEDAPRLSYTLEAEDDAVVNISLTSDIFDTYLSVEDAGGSTLATNDDASGTNSMITGFSVDAGEVYTIIAESYSSHNRNTPEEGEFTLSIAEQSISRIEYTQEVNGELSTSEPTLDYVFTGQEGDVIIISQTSTDFDSYVYLLDSSGSEIAYNDDGGGNSNSLIGPFTLPASGSYTVRAASYGGDGTGSFTLNVDKIDLAPIEVGEDIEISFTEQDTVKYFTFEATTGDTVSIAADSDGEFDTDLVLNDIYNYEIASDADGGAGPDPEIFQQSLSQTGTYTIVLTAVNPGEGKVTLTVTTTAPPSLDDGVQTISFSNSQYSRALTFTAEGGESVRLSLNVTDEDMTGSPSISVTQDGTTIASISGSYISNVEFSFTPSSDGEVVVQVTDYSYDSVSYEVALGQNAE